MELTFRMSLVGDGYLTIQNNQLFGEAFYENGLWNWEIRKVAEGFAAALEPNVVAGGESDSRLTTYGALLNKMYELAT